MPRGGGRRPKRIELGPTEVEGPSEPEQALPEAPEPEEEPVSPAPAEAGSFRVRLSEAELVENHGVGDEWVLSYLILGQEDKIELASLPQPLYEGPAQDLNVIIRVIEKDAAQDDVGEAELELPAPWTDARYELEVVVYEDGQEGDRFARWRFELEVGPAGGEPGASALSSFESRVIAEAGLITWSLPSPSFSLIGAGDINGDGLADLVAAGPRSSVVSLFGGSGSGEFELMGRLGVRITPDKLLVADFNGDSLGDLVAIAWAEQHANLLLSRGEFQLAPPISIGIPPGAWDVQVNQLNDHPGWELVWFTRRGPIVWSFTRQGRVVEWMNAPSELSFVMLTPPPYVWTDVDGDGSPDLAYYSHNPGEIFLRLHTGTVLEVGVTPNRVSLSQLVAADVDGDGTPDLLGLGPQGQIYIWELQKP